MRRVRRDHDQIPGLQQVLLASAQAARFPLDNRPHRELGVAVVLIGLAAARVLRSSSHGRRSSRQKVWGISRVWFTALAFAAGISRL